MVKLFFLDIDGTIAMPGSDPTPTLRRAIKLLQAQGDKVFLCTGRSTGFVPEAVQTIPWDGGVYSAGGYVLAGKKEIFRCFMPPKTLDAVTAVLDQIGASYTLECEKAGFRAGEDLIPMLESLKKEQLHSELQRLISMNNRKLPVEQYKGEPVFKVSFILRSEEQAKRLQALQPENTDLVFFDNFAASGLIFFGEISDTENNKGKSMLRLCAYYGLTAADCVAFGDSMNDAAVIRAAGEGWAMGNASPKVKAIADKVCGNCTEDGLAIALMTYVKNPPVCGENRT